MSISPSQFSCSSQSSIFSEDDVTMMSSSNGMYFDDLYDMSVFLYKGQFGDTYRCVERETGTKYAVKVLNQTGTENWNSNNSHNNSKINFTREGAIWRRLKHRNVVELCRIFSTPKENFLVTEYVKDGKLFDQLPQYESYREQDVCSIMRQLLEGMAYLRKRHVIYRCLTTENLLVKQTAFGENILKISDFSLALRMERGQKYVKVEPYAAPLFVAPEVLLENPINCGVDAWAVGVIFYILLTGQPPFWSEKLELVYEDIVTREVVNNTSNNTHFDGVSFHAKEVLNGLLDKNMKTRLSPDSALNHPWFKSDEPISTKETGLSSAIKLKQFNEFRKSGSQLLEVRHIFSDDEDTYISRQKTPSDISSTSEIIQSYGGMRRKKQFDAENKRNSFIIDSSASDERRRMKVVSRTKTVGLINNTCTAKVFLSFKPKKTYVKLNTS